LGDSFLFNTRENVDTLFNEQRLQIIILQVSIVGIIALGRDPGHHHRRD
jgi:inositol transport system permease protein